MRCHNNFVYSIFTSFNTLATKLKGAEHRMHNCAKILTQERDSENQRLVARNAAHSLLAVAKIEIRKKEKMLQNGFCYSNEWRMTAYPSSGGTVISLDPPTFIPSRPRSRPFTTWFTPLRNTNGCRRFMRASKTVPSGNKPV